MVPEEQGAVAQDPEEHQEPLSIRTERAVPMQGGGARVTFAISYRSQEEQSWDLSGPENRGITR